MIDWAQVTTKSANNIPLQTMIHICEDDSTCLLSLLKSRDEETFSQRCAEQRGKLDRDHKEVGTYLQYACLDHLPKAVEALLWNGADPNCTTYHNWRLPIRIAQDRGYDDIVKMLLLDSCIDIPPSLYTLLEDRDEETFSQRCAQERSELHKNKGKYTYLQLACQYGLPKAVKALLANGVDPNCTADKNQFSPIMIAAQEGYYNIVQILEQHDKVNYKSTVKELLHALLVGMSKARERDDSSSVMEKYVDFMKLMLEKLRFSKSWNINAQYANGCTLLHLAVQLQEDSIIPLLLEYGAFIGLRCNQGWMPISLMNADIFEEYLNNCVQTNGKLLIDKDCEIIYNYNFLEPKIYHNELGVGQRNYALVSETEPLVEFGEVPEFCHLLKHPVLASFLYVKWYTVRKYFWINFTFYLTFWLSLTLYMLAIYSLYDNEGAEQQKNLVALWTWYSSIVLCSLLGLRELLKFFILAMQYITDVENLLIVALLTLNVLVLSSKVTSEVAAIALLLTWTELVLLINRHPSLSSNIKMYKAVSTSFLKLLMRSSILIVAFALSFHLLFKDVQQINARKNIQMKNNTCIVEDNDPKFFEHKGTSLFKVILMMTGEFDANTIPFHYHRGVSHVIFILFVFLVSIVLFNLMNGLAVSDTQAIRNDAKIVGYASLAKEIASIEKMINLICCVISSPMLEQNVKLFPHKLPNPRLHVLPNQGNRVVFSKLRQKRGFLWKMRNFCSILGYGSLCITSKVMNETKKILNQQRSKAEEDKRSSKCLCRHSEKLEKLLEKLETYSEKSEEHGRRLTRLEEKMNGIYRTQGSNLQDRSTETRYNGS